MAMSDQRSRHVVRRRGRVDPFRKPGWQVPTSVANAVREAVAAGAAESQNALVEEALLRHLAELRREKLYAAYEEAARDEAFLADMRTISNAFDAAVPDGLGD